MKVLFLTNIPAPYRVDFFNELGKFCELTVLYELENATDRNKNWKADEAKNFNEVFLNGKRINADSAIGLSVIKFLRDKSYDIIVIGGYSTPIGMLAIEYLKLTKRKFVLNSDGGIIKADSKLKFMIKKHFIGSASAWLSTGKNTDDYLIHYGANKEKIYKYPLTSIKKNDILTQTISKEEKIKIRKLLNVKEEKMIISVGQFIHRKGYDILIKAMKEVPKSYGVYIIGGEPTEEYINLKKKYDLDNLHFIGFKSKEDLKKYYKVADLFVLPTREDIWGLVINEAMSYGLPVVTTNKCIAGMELIKDKINGFITNVNDHKLLAQRIIEILEDDALKLEINKNNIEKAKEYCIEKMSSEHINIFSKIINDDN